MRQIIDQISVEGIQAATVDVASRRGGDTVGHATKWKVYYQLSAEPGYGVLLAHENEDATLKEQRAKLDEEAGNFKRLRKAGFDVPDTAQHSIDVTDYLAGGVRAAALVVEHIAGPGPYKARTEVSAIRKIVGQDETRKALHLLAWARLSKAAQAAAPMDLQVILADDGRIVTIDPEKVGPGYSLPSLGM